MGRTTFFLLEQEQKANNESKKEQETDIDYEEKVKEYHTGSGWYDMPGYEKNMRKEEAIKMLKESDS